MQRLPTFITLTALTMAPGLFAQEIVSTRVFTEPSGVRFFVDGQLHYSAATFLWPKGSKHILTIDSPVIGALPSQNSTCPDGGAASATMQYDASCQSRYKFLSWETNTGSFGTAGIVSQVITADSSTTFFKANFNVEYRVDVAFFVGDVTSAQNGCATPGALGPRPPNAGPGIVFVAGICYPFSTSVWLPPGEYPVQAMPYEGFVFSGWNVGPKGGIATVKVNGPMVLNPRFEPAKRVRFFTSPLGLKVSVDRTVVPTIDPDHFVVTYPIPGYFDWAMNTTHTMGAPSPQVDLGGRTWVFDSWSNGGGQESTFMVRDTNTIETFTARFVRGASVSFVTEPNGLKLNVDGRSSWPSLNFVWPVGARYTVSAPAEQTDSRGRKYTFRSWSNGGPATQDVVIEQGHIESGFRLIATYDRVPQTTVESSFGGLTIKVDGADCRTPCRIDRPVGTQVRLEVPQTIPISGVSRREFVGWGDSDAPIRTITVEGDARTVFAAYRTSNRLIAVSDPEEAVDFRMEPSSADGFYPEDTNVSIVANAKPGFKFRRWEGDLSGTVRSGVVSMNISRIVRASFDKVPYIPPAGVKNAAGETPESGVAAGSLISIFGASLSKGFEVGPAHPLAQTLGGTVVLLGDRLLPLVFVSPEQINAQLPSDLEPGSYTLIVKSEGLPDVTASFEVVRNSPGLFANVTEEKAYAVALHEDGSPVLPSSPARLNESIMLLATGCGPYIRRLPDGFQVPASPVNDLADAADVLVGEFGVLPPSWTGAFPGMVGVCGVKLRVTRDLPASSATELRVRINGKQSNPVLLAIE